MELDELKKELNQKISGGAQQRTEMQIASLLDSSATSIVQKLRRSLVAELVISVLFMCVCLYMIFFNPYWAYRVFFITFSVVGIGFTIVLFLLLKKIDALSGASNVMQNLDKLIHILDEYVRRYLQLTLILLPICFVFGIWISYNDGEQVLKPLEKRSIALLAVTMVSLATIVYFFTKWYLKKLYGNYIQQLKALLRELAEEAD